MKRSIEEGEKRFNQLSIEERGKFDEETLVNVNSIKRQSSKIQRATSFSNEYIVVTLLKLRVEHLTVRVEYIGFGSFLTVSVVHVQVTILVAAEGIHKLQPINGSADLKEALHKLGSIPRNKIMVRDCIR